MGLYIHLVLSTDTYTQLVFWYGFLYSIGASVRIFVRNSCSITDHIPFLADGVGPVQCRLPSALGEWEAGGSAIHRSQLG